MNEARWEADPSVIEFHLIVERDTIALVVTFLVSVICGVEIGLLTGAVFNLIDLLRPSARPRVQVIECKV